MRSGAGHDSQGNVWHKIEDDDCDFINSEELKIGLPYPSVVNIEHGGVYLARPIPYGHYLNDSNDHEAEIDDGTPPGPESVTRPRGENEDLRGFEWMGKTLETTCVEENHHESLFRSTVPSMFGRLCSIPFSLPSPQRSIRELRVETVRK